MKVYLAGAIEANLKPIWTQIATMDSNRMTQIIKVLNGGGFSRAREIDEVILGRDDVRKYEQRHSPIQKWGGFSYDKDLHKPYILESFYYADETTEKMIPHFGDFLLDSGAFTFMMNANKAARWDEYIEQYADFINRNDVKKFFELDIDSVVGYDEVIKMRKHLEHLTHKQPIPVWHKNRGAKEFIKNCDEYPYIAIGGIVSGEWSKEAERLFPWFINEAHKRGVKIHGLGYTKLSKLKKYKFDSVDSTAWTTGNRFGFLYKFNGQTMVKIDMPKGKRFAKDRSRDIALNNYLEWIKFQKYAEKFL